MRLMGTFMMFFLIQCSMIRLVHFSIQRRIHTVFIHDDAKNHTLKTVPLGE